jgi:hypothetical protein
VCLIIAAKKGAMYKEVTWGDVTFCDCPVYAAQLAHATMTHGSLIAQFMQHNWQFYRFQLAILRVLCTPS